MTHLTKYGRRMRLTLISAMTAACFACLVAIPFVDKRLFNNEVGYYSIVFEGNEIGAANTEEEAQLALSEARLKFSQDYDSVVYMNPDINIVKENKLVSERMSQDELSSVIYSNLFSSVVEMDKQIAYTVRIDDYTVSLATKDEVVELMEKITSKYDSNNEFQVSLATSDETGKNYAVDVVKSEIKNTDTDIVAAALNGTAKTTEQENKTNGDGITEISFEEPVVVSQAPSSYVTLTSVQDAYDAITKEKAEKTVYYVQEGDCLSKIASNHHLSVADLLALNEGMTEDSVIVPGDEVTITVPKSEISVVTTERKTYEEDFDAEVEYIDDDSAYRGTNTVVSEGVQGHRKVTADVTYVNGNQTEINYVDQQVTKEATPKVIKVGTKTKPTYMRPISGGSVSSTYGNRSGEFHKGVDWSVSTGTSVTAATDGSVIRAGFYSGYGYCVEIKHADGSMTRYGHLSSIKVSVGQNVTQGQQIALSGNTGNSSGPHLHFEIWINGNTVNPLDYVNKN